MIAKLDVRAIDDRTSVVDVQGALTRGCDQAMATAFDRANGLRTHTIILNFDRLDYLSSGGLCSLAMLLAKANARGQRVFACGLNDHFRDVFCSTRLAEAIFVFDSEAHALGAAAVRRNDRGAPTAPPRSAPRRSARARVRDCRAFWAKRVSVLRVSKVPIGAIDETVHGRRVAGPMQGFGKMWRKSYRVCLDGTPHSPADVIATWKTHFPSFWPTGNRFFRPLTGITPGEVALISLDLPGPVELSTGVLVLYADGESFTLMTPQGHTFAGWITFSAGDEQGRAFAQAEVLMRASDPLYEIGMALFGHRQEDACWRLTLRSLAEHLGVDAEVETHSECVDHRRQWPYAANVWHNAAIRSGLLALTMPLRWSTRRRRGTTDRLVGGEL